MAQKPRAVEPAENAEITTPAPTEFPQKLEEFCMRQSAIKNTCLIAGFYYCETTAGRLRDLPSAYAKRYAEFANEPAM